MAKKSKAKPVRGVKSRVKVPAKMPINKAKLTPPDSDSIVVKGQVRDTCANPMPGGIVHGTITRGGKPVDCAIVEVREQVMRGGLIGLAKTRRDGTYEVHYTADKLCRPTRGGANLFIRVVDDQRRTVAESDVRVNAGPEETIDLALPDESRGMSEYSRLVAAVEPELDDVPRHSLEPDDVPYLASRTGFGEDLIARLRDSAREHHEAESVEESTFYGLLRVQPATVPDLLAKDAATWQDLLERAVRGGIIPAMSSEAVEDQIKALRALKAKRALNHKDEKRPTSLGDLLTATGVSPDKQGIVAVLHTENAGAFEGISRALDARTDFSKGEADAVRLALQLGDITNYHLPLVQELERRTISEEGQAGRRQKRAKPMVQQRGPVESHGPDLTAIAALDAEDWKAILKRRQPDGRPIGAPAGTPGATDEERLENYAASLSDRVEAAIPTKAIAVRVAKDAAPDSPFRTESADLQTFFANNPDFDFRSEPVDTYLREDRDEKLDGVENPKALSGKLRAMGRVFKVAPKFKEMRAMLADDIHSSSSIVQLGKRAFRDRYAEAFGSEARADEVYKAAELVNLTALTLFLDLSVAARGNVPYVMGGDTPPETEVPAAPDDDGPTWSSIFGTLDLCDCEHCKSLYSPAAYFVDILRFVADGPTKNDRNPLEVLLERRPDLEHIELTCENTKTPLPYVDLAKEILEAALVPCTFEIAEGADITTVLTNLRNGQMPAGFPAAFIAGGYPLTDQASVRADRSGRTTEPTSWIVLDVGWAFSLKYQGTFEGFRVLAWPQTSWTAAELRAQPEHTHDPAYTVLRDAPYPWNLPLNLPIEETRTYLNHLGVPRHELMTTYFRLLPEDAWSSPAIAYEYLGLTPEMASIITREPIGTAPLKDMWSCYGLQEQTNSVSDPTDGTAPPATGDWDVVLSRVSIFLRQSGLRYDELLELLGTRYINPVPAAGSGRTLTIVSADPERPTTCALSKLQIVAADRTQTAAARRAVVASALDRIHRFVRLWRTLKWTARDLDKAITAFKPARAGQTDLTPDFLVQLSHVERVRAQFNLPVVQLLAWWADIDVNVYRDHLKDDGPEVPSLYITLFSNRAAAGQSLPADPDDLGGSLDASAPAIVASLRISAADLALLHANLNVVPLAAGVVDDALTLKNLSRLYRHAALARALKYPIRTYLSTLELLAADPFATTRATLEYLRRIETIRTAGFSVAELDYMLRHQSEPGSRVPISDDQIADLLDVMRADLRAIVLDHTFIDAAADANAATSDPQGEQTRQRLALLNWETAIVDQLVAILNNTFTFSTPLAALDPAVVIPADLIDKVAYDAAASQLRFTGTMSAAEQTLLTTAPNTEANFVAAVDALFAAPRSFVRRHMSRFRVPSFDTGLAAFPANVRIPDVLKTRYYYDAPATRLRFVGIMTETERALLKQGVTDPTYAGAIDALFNAANAAPAASDAFLTSAGPDDIAALFGTPTTQPEERFLLVLKKLMPYLRSSLSERAVTQRISEGLDLESNSASALLKQWIASTVAGQRAMADFVSPAFAESHASLASTRASFPNQFSTVQHLHKIALLCERFGMTSKQLGWLFEFGLGNWLDLNTLPLTATGASQARFQSWARLADLCRLRDGLPDAERLLTAVFTKARATGTTLANLFDLLRDGVGWPVVELTALCAATTGFNLDVDVFKTETGLMRLAAAFRVQRKLGATANACLTWTKPDATYAEVRTAARDIRSLVRARLDEAQWLEIAKSLHDPLRERQRSALVSYLVAQRGLRSSDELFAQLLIDVEMSPCMMTSRIKQATNAVQLFVQRALMSLEEDVALTPAEAKQWQTWQKSGAVWEANRKVLLYPENWIEPDLRDDKTPFFKEMEDELLQNDVTDASAEDAFLHYLEKLDQVARLDIVGMYQQMETAEPAILHVIGRTHGTPHVYFNRRLENGVWSPWARIDVDIEGDHVVPVVWNRRLHLYWATFTEKTAPLTKEERAANADPKKFWEIKCAWSQFRNGKWLPKRISTTALEHPKYPFNVPQDPKHFSFKTRIQPGPAGDQLSLECYGPKVTVTEAVTVTTQVNENVERIVDFYRHNDVFGNAAGYQMAVRFQVDRSIPRLQDHVRIKVNLYKADGTPITPQLTLNSKGETMVPSTQKTFIVTEDIYCELVSDAFMIYSVSPKWEWFDIPGGVGVTVDLVPWTKPSPETWEIEAAKAAAKPMRPIGEFVQEDASGDVVAVRAEELYFPMDPPALDPVPTGTSLQHMQLVEDRNTDRALGRMKVLEKITGRPFRLLMSHEAGQYGGINFTFPLFFQDDRRTYIVHRLMPFNPPRVRFDIFFHSRVPQFMRALNRLGIDGLLTLDNQRLIDEPLNFGQYLPSTTLVDGRWPKEDVDFSYGGSYAQYNWELFFHAPFLIAIQLMRNQKFAEAQKWFHYIFNPTATDSPERPGDLGPERFWRVKPFYDAARGGIETLEELMADDVEFEDQVREWAANPFKPHVLARLRITAYMKAVVMRYVDNLIAWGDQLFRRDTMESINEATQLYVLAGQILGRRPERIPPRAAPQLQTFRTLDDLGRLDSLSNAVVALEGFLPTPVSAPMTVKAVPPPSRPLTMPFFCLTANDKLLGYWDTVADRLFKIRHCMNIEGVVRELPLFDPPIDPGLLVRAAAAGVDLSSALGDINAPIPPYRFRVMVQKASELCGEVKSLGAALLSALEKRDAEALALLRSGHELELLKVVRLVKEKQVEEAAETLQGLFKYQDVVTTRRDYYTSRPFLNTFEMAHLGLTAQSLVPMGIQAGSELLAGILHLIPEMKGGAPTTIGITYGGDNVGPAAQAFASVSGTMASMMSTMGSLSATLGGYERRQDDWDHQAELAARELEQVKKQIAAATVRSAIAEQELKNHDRQAEQNTAAHEFMRDKFTNQELYNWMVGQVAGIYFQSYQLAYDVAKRVERAFRHELGLKDSSFVKFGYWDSLKKGLLAGERLHHDLHRMDTAYLDQNKREHEITKHVSLSALDPVSLLKLKLTGECFVNLPEALFDLDYPGHYMRRLKAVAVTIPCVAGPYTNVNCTVTQHNSTIRMANTLIQNQHARQGDDDPRFVDVMGGIQAIVTSTAQNDSGLFEANLRDERYLPFEGKGVIGSWRIQIQKDFPAIDPDTISDVVLHLRYTARDGGEPLRKAATDELSESVDAAVRSADQQGLARSFSLRHEFPSDWHRFLNPPAGYTGDQVFNLNFAKSRFPFMMQSKPIALNKIRLFVKLKPEFIDDYFDNGELNVSLQAGTTPSTNPLALVEWKKNGNARGLVRADLETTDPLGDWTLGVWRKVGADTTHRRVDPKAIEDIVAVCSYTISA